MNQSEMKNLQKLKRDYYQELPSVKLRTKLPPHQKLDPADKAGNSILKYHTGNLTWTKSLRVPAIFSQDPGRYAVSQVIRLYSPPRI
ncbi:unnamed protein product [Allacma fusca]|uniref:Uncharacterized protein n=1 Tax=Allacma fusca TaxID=39272 RepID=A0A8J2JNZ2_9HEXA|nr:unnamed protein product [Allacma fusca]